MARPLRLTFAGGVYHVTARGNERKAIVRDDTDRARFVDTLAAMVEHYRVQCHAWVLMDNHYHLLLETPSPNLSQALRHLNGVYTQRFNRRHRRVGHLFQGRFKAIVVEKEAYLLELCRYVVLNPVRARVVSTPQAYRWSSYRATAGLMTAPPWLTVDWVLEQFGLRRGAAQAKYRAFVAEGIQHQGQPWEQVVGQVYLGGEAFVRRVQRHRTSRGSESEIPRAQRQPCWLRPETVLERVAQHYGLRGTDLVQPTRRPSEARQVALYGLRRWAGESLLAIARRMGVTYSAVSRRVSAVERQLAADRRWAVQLAKLSDVKVKI
ncbi:MAG: transposase [Nitrospiraceae bacterium]